MYSIIVSPQAETVLKKLDKPLVERIIGALERIKIRPETFVEKLVGEPGYKLRVGDYRVIMDIKNQELQIIVIEIGRRKNIYKH